MLEFIMLTPIAGSAGFFVFARANIFYYISLILSPPYHCAVSFFLSLCLFLSLSLTGFAFFNSIYFWIYTYLCTWDSFPLTVSNFYARPENSFYLPLSSFFSPYFWRVLMKIDAAKVRKGYWRV